MNPNDTMYLFFDTETSGLPKSYKAPLTDLANWPRLIQLAYLVFDSKGNKVAGDNVIVKPEGFEIPADACKIHGITTERALAEGKDLRKTVEEFFCWVTVSDMLVAHNMSFDEKIVGAELIRCGYNPIPADKPKICTMLASVKHCNLRGPFGPKWPKLAELHRILFGKDFEGAHDASSDIAATAKCFWELKRLGVIKI